MSNPIVVKIGYKFLIEKSDFPDQIGKLCTVSNVINTYESYRGMETVFELEEVATTYDTFCGTFYKEVKK